MCLARGVSFPNVKSITSSTLCLPGWRSDIGIESTVSPSPVMAGESLLIGRHCRVG